MDPKKLIKLLAIFEKSHTEALKLLDVDYINERPVAPPYLEDSVKNNPLLSSFPLPKMPEKGTGRPSIKEKGTVTRLRYAMSIWQRRWQYTLKANGMSMENARARIQNFYNDNLDKSAFQPNSALTLSFKTLDDHIAPALTALLPYMGGVKGLQRYCNILAKDLRRPQNTEAALVDWEIIYADILMDIAKAYRLGEELDMAMRNIQTKIIHGSAIRPGENGQAGAMDTAIWEKDARYRLSHELQMKISLHSLTNLSMLFPHYRIFEPLNEIGVHIGHLCFMQPPPELSQDALAILDLWLDECRTKGAAALNTEDDYTKAVRIIFDYDTALQPLLPDALKAMTPCISEKIQQAITEK